MDPVMARLQEVTLADLFHLPYGSVVFDPLGHGNVDKRPYVKNASMSRRLWNDFLSRPTWQPVKGGI